MSDVSSQPHGEQGRPGTLGLLGSWQPGFYLGALTIILGLVVALNPSTSLNVVSVLLGVLLLVSGLLYVVKAIGADSQHRGWTAIAGLAFIVLGVVLVRHLHVTVVLIALLVGITWIVQGVIELMAVPETHGSTRTWLILSGAVSLVAGIVVVATPIDSVTVLTVLLGIWWIILGALQIVNALRMRHQLRQPLRPVQTRSPESAPVVGWPDQSGHARKSSSG